jgi:CheY-like chemotaxis protein
LRDLRVKSGGNVPKTVLIVDDEELMRSLLTSLLSLEPYELCEASTGEEALGMVRSAPPALIVLDHQMPGLTGSSVCKSIKSDPQLRQIRIVMVTADPADEIDARGAGADAYLCKPFNPQLLLQTVASLLADA